MKTKIIIIIIINNNKNKDENNIKMKKCVMRITKEQRISERSNHCDE